jgi:RHS repeat-associated protein
MLTDENGEVLWLDGVTPFGESTGETGFIEHTTLYTGKELDVEIGLYYFNARWYDASLGRFTTEDPIRDGLNWFVYVGNNPLIFIDPSGLQMGPPRHLRNTGERRSYGPAPEWGRDARRRFVLSMTFQNMESSIILGGNADSYYSTNRCYLNILEGVANYLDIEMTTIENLFISKGLDTILWKMINAIIPEANNLPDDFSTNYFQSNPNFWYELGVFERPRTTTNNADLFQLESGTIIAWKSTEWYINAGPDHDSGTVGSPGHDAIFDRIEFNEETGEYKIFIFDQFTTQNGESKPWSFFVDLDAANNFISALEDDGQVLTNMEKEFLRSRVLSDDLITFIYSRFNPDITLYEITSRLNAKMEINQDIEKSGVE